MGPLNEGVRTYLVVIINTEGVELDVSTRAIVLSRQLLMPTPRADESVSAQHIPSGSGRRALII